MLVPDVLFAELGESHPSPIAAVSPPRWAAPRAAYLLTAAVADNTEHVDAVDPPQVDILIALGAQTRLALTMLRAKLGTEIEMDTIAAATVMCPAAMAAARELIKPRPGSMAMPECARCREIIAKAMCSLQIQAYSRLGCTPAMIAAMCRQSADAAETSPRH